MVENKSSFFDPIVEKQPDTFGRRLEGKEKPSEGRGGASTPLGVSAPVFLLEPMLCCLKSKSGGNEISVLQN